MSSTRFYSSKAIKSGRRWHESFSKETNMLQQHIFNLFSTNPLPPEMYLRHHQQRPSASTSTSMHPAGPALNFKVMVNLCHFMQEEIKVSIENNCLLIRGEHRDIPDEHGYIARKFIRSYPLPEGNESAHVKASWSEDGILTVVVPIKISKSLNAGRVIPISVMH